MFFNKKKENANSQNDDRIKVDTSTITTMVGSDTVVEGLLKTKSSIRINGTVNGDVRADGIVILTKSGKIEGTIEAESIIVAGVVKGNMSIRDKVNVEATGEIYGEVITKKFVIDEESIFQGNCVMNREGKMIPVTPYITEEEKEKEKSKAESQKSDEKKEDDKKSDDKADAEEKKSDVKADESEKKDDAEEKTESESDKSDDKKDSDEEETEDTEHKEEQSDDTIIIADINEVEGADDIPASDGDQNEGPEQKNKNFVKKSKSLSVEIEE